MYIYHDRLRDKYQSFSTMQALSDHTEIPYDTLKNHFTRSKKDRYVTKEAEVIVKTKMIKNRRF